VISARRRIVLRGVSFEKKKTPQNMDLFLELSLTLFLDDEGPFMYVLERLREANRLAEVELW
jgi:hypothetical protein